MATNVSVKILPGSLICEDRTEISGDVTINPKNIIHVNVKIASKQGSIVFGEGNLIEEQTEIINPEREKTPNHKMTIGNFNYFEVGAHCEALSVGDNNVFECKSYVGPNARISNGCIIGAKCVFDPPVEEVLPENTIIFGSHNTRRVLNDRPTPQLAQMECLAKVLPNFQYIKKSTEHR